jgi:hypothetical protein
MKTTTNQILLLFVWLAAVSTGAVVLLNFENAPGRSGQTPQQWPADSPITLDPARSTLLLFVHPRCPCTRASIGELNRLLTHCEGRVAAHVVYLKPASVPDDWTQTDSLRNAAMIPNVSVFADLNGALASRFGAETSGYAVLFDNQGRQLFKGGITAARGHSGDNAGANAIVSLVAGQKTDFGQTPVFGCSLMAACETGSPGSGAGKK